MSQHICINIGNTHTQVALLDDGKLNLLEVAETSQVIADGGSLPTLEKLSSGWSGAAVCVVPKLKALMSARYGANLSFLGWREFSGSLDFSGVDTSTLGMDRIANAYGAFTLCRGACIVVDCGTCLNTVIVDGSGHFLGGAILPGRRIMRQGLHDHTAQLPLLELRSAVPSPIGKNTLDALAAGTDLASIGGLREVLSATVKALPTEKFSIYATGGDATFFLKAMPDLLTSAPPLLTLQGVAHLSFGQS